MLHKRLKTQRSSRRAKVAKTVGDNCKSQKAVVTQAAPSRAPARERARLAKELRKIVVFLRFTSFF